MQFVAITTRLVDAFSEADFAAVLDVEAQRARALYTDGTFRALYSRDDVPGAVILIEAADLDAARSAVDSLPLAQRRMMDVQLVPLRPYRGFAVERP